MADLLFERPRVTTGDLVFGDDGAPTGDASAVIGGEFAPLAGALFARVGTQAHVAGTFAPLVGVIAAVYDSNTQRPIVGQRVAPWQVADKPSQPGVAAGHRDAAHAPTGWAAFWDRATGVPAGMEHRLPDVLKSSPVARLARFQDATGVHDGVGFLHQDATRVHAQRDGVFQDGRKVRGSTDFRHQDGDRTKRPSRLVLWQAAQALRAIRGTDFQGAKPSPHGWAGRFQDGVPPPPGLSLRPVDPPNPPGCYTPSGALVFSWPWGDGGSQLLYQCGDFKQSQFVIPLLRVYMTVHNITAHLLPGLEPVQLRGLTIDSDDDGYGWRLAASGPEHLMDQLAPTAGLRARVRVVVDGIAWVFAIDPPARSREFGQREVSVRGASVTSMLAAPHMPVSSWSNANDMTAQQLVIQALEFTGVDLSWAIPDWLVPAGVWNFRGTPLAAVLRVAEAAGAVVRSDTMAERLHIVSRYPHLPWEWGAVQADVQMPGQVMTRDDLQFVAQTEFNAVYVSGETQAGVLGQVVRRGTPGDLLADQVTDQLITHSEVARERGRSVLGAAAIKLRQQITVPLLTGGTNPGLILPGYLIEVNEPAETWRGMVRSISINEAMPTVRQSLTVERAA